MKRRKLMRHLVEHGCVVEKEGGRHTWIYNPIDRRRSFVPRHPEIGPGLVREICKQLGVAAPRERQAASRIRAHVFDKRWSDVTRA
jgi:predicted RNA binding protein YcfA (HicA-like mRNA interferase family)